MEKPIFIKFDHDNFRMLPQDIKPIPGYFEPINEETGELFPYCCPHHKQIFDDAVNWFSKFPYCCEEHKKLPQTHLFAKEKYEGTPLKIVKQISFTEHQIIEVIDKSDWYKHVADYIEYNLWSFGQPNVGAEIYMKWILSFINNEHKKISKDKKQKLISYLNSCFEQNPKSVPQFTDWNILNSTYQSWLKIFPFELTSYFGDLKQHFVNILPFLNGPIEVNIYSGLAKSRLHTKASLFEALISLTNELLTQINGKSLYEKGHISDTSKIKLELINANRSQKLIKGYHNSSPDEEHRYRKMIKDWLKDEKAYFNEISPLLKPKQPQNMETSIDPIKYMEFKKSSFYSNLLEENNFTTQEADELYQFIIETIKLLTKIRSDEFKSHNLVIDRAKGLDKNPLFDRMSRMFQHWLVKALKNDDTYVYAYNYLAQKMNREMHQVVYKVKFISDTDLYFMLQKEINNSESSVPNNLIKQLSHSVDNSKKLTLQEYKNKLDSTLSYYSIFPLVLKFMKNNESDLLDKAVSQLKVKEEEVLDDEHLLTEQIHFDLNSTDINKFYKYGFKKIQEIVNAFKFLSKGINNWFDIENLDKEIFEIWHKYSSPESTLIVISDRPKDFFKILHRSLAGTLKLFEKQFANSYSLSNGPIDLPKSLEEKQEMNRQESIMRYSKKSSLDNSYSSLLIHKSGESQNTRRLTLILFNFNNYFNLVSKTELVPFSTIPGSIDREVYRQDANSDPDFNLIFTREYNNFISKGSPISYIAFCNLEFKKINKWIKEYEDLTESIENKDLNPVYPDGYRRALSYHEYLTKLKMTSDFYFMDDTPYQRIARGKHIIFEDDDVIKEKDLNEDNEISTSLVKNGKLVAKLKEFNFFDLQKVAALTVSSQSKLSGFLDENDIPYTIAMLNYLGFINHFEQNHCDNKKDMHKKLAFLFDSTERTIRGNVNVLSGISKDNKERYTSYKYIETVNIHYNKLK